MAKFLLGSTIALLMMACQQAPTTKIYRGMEELSKLRLSSLSSPIELKPNVKVIDARSPFAFGLSHAHGAISLQWDDYVNAEKKAHLQSAESMARRLSLLGIAQDTPVVVVGEGLGGMGEEARVAWMLMYLGVRDVQTLREDRLKIPRAKGEEPPSENVRAWTPDVQEALLVSPKEFARALSGPRSPEIKILDVRSKAEYLKKTSDQGLDIGAVHIPWQEFFTQEGRPDLNMRGRLDKINIKLQHRILVVSDRGLRSGAVAYALQMMGFTKAGSYALAD